MTIARDELVEELLVVRHLRGRVPPLELHLGLECSALGSCRRGRAVAALALIGEFCQMRRGFSQSPLTNELEHFQQLVRSHALARVNVIIRAELQSRIDALNASLVVPTTSRRPKRPKKVTAIDVRAETTVETPPRVQACTPSEAKQKWTRDSIIAELASWLASGTTIDASFLTRHGPRGLVAASRREFGRFEAALNVAGLRVAQLYPDKLPTS